MSSVDFAEGSRKPADASLLSSKIGSNRPEPDVELRIRSAPMKKAVQMIFAAMLFCAGAASAADSAQFAVAAFYDRFIHLSYKHYGRPSFERVTDLVTPDLLALLKAQDKYERYCARIAPPDIKPHMIDQNPFFLAPDGIEQFLGTKSLLTGRTAKVVAHLGDGYFTWHDTVVLRRLKGRWQVADIVWGGGGALSKRLEKFMQYRCNT
jgi:hypothetical protein